MKALAALTALLLPLVSTPALAHVIDLTGTFAPEAAGATGTGSLSLQYDDEGHTLAINATWSGLSGTNTVAHIHCCTASPGTGTNVDHVGRGPNDLFVVLNDNDSVVLLGKFPKNGRQSTRIEGMQTDRGLVEDVADSRQTAADLAGQA